MLKSWSWKSPRLWSLVWQELSVSWRHVFWSIWTVGTDGLCVKFWRLASPRSRPQQTLCLTVCTSFMTFAPR
jgi:hypothetical protein